jgi:hypothetical protein
MTTRDLELLDLLRDEPELLAIADAVATTQRRRRMRRPLFAIPVLAAALITVVLFAPWQGSGPGLTARALAAVGDEPVLHAVVREQRPVDWYLVDLSTGARSAPPLTVETELWYDRSRGLEHKLTRTNGRLTEDELQTPDGVTTRGGPVFTCAWIARHPVEATRERVSCRLDGENGTVPRKVPEPAPIVDPALGGFVSGYRDALAAGTVREGGEGEIDGRPVSWLELTLEQPRPPGADRDLEPIRERVAVDRETYRPLLVRAEHGVSYEVVTIETVAAQDADFSKPVPLPAEERVSSGTVVAWEEVGLHEARSVLRRQALWAGRQIEGLELVHVEHQILKTGYARNTGLAPRQSEGLELEYKSGAAFLTIQEATEPSFAYRWATPDRLWSVPPVGAVRIQPFGWGFLHREGLYVSIMSSLGEQAVLAAAKALEPIPG